MIIYFLQMNYQSSQDVKLDSNFWVSHLHFQKNPDINLHGTINITSLSSSQNQESLVEAPLNPSLTGKDTLKLLQGGDAPLVVTVQDLKLDQLEQKINALEDSEEYKTLAKMNRPWFGEPTDQERGESMQSHAIQVVWTGLVTRIGNSVLVAP